MSWAAFHVDMFLQQGLVFIFVLLASVLVVCGLLLLRLFVAGAFVFITALLLRGVLLLSVSKYVRVSRPGRVASGKRAW